MILKVEFELKLSIYTSLKRFICLKWILKNFFMQYYILSSTTIHCRSLPLRTIVLQFKPENCEIRRRLLDSSYDLKYSVKHSNYAVCTAVISLQNAIFLTSLSKTICFVTTSNKLKYCLNVVFLFHSLLVLTVNCENHGWNILRT